MAYLGNSTGIDNFDNAGTRSNYSKLYTVPGTGSFDINSIQGYFYALAAGCTGRFVIYDSSDNRVCQGTSTFSVEQSAAWQTQTAANLTGTKTLTGGASYRIGVSVIAGANSIRWYYNNTGVSGDSYDNTTDYATSGWGATLPAADVSTIEYLLQVEYTASASGTIELEGFRFRNDDGSESAATWKANQDTNITLAAGTAFRLRKLLNATGDPASIGAQLECSYKPSGGSYGSWRKVDSV